MDFSVIIIIPDSNIILHVKSFDELFSGLLTLDLVSRKTKIYLCPINTSQVKKDGLTRRHITNWINSILPKISIAEWFKMDLLEINNYEDIRKRIFTRYKRLGRDIARFALNKEKELSLKEEIDNDLHLLIKAIYEVSRDGNVSEVIILTKDEKAYSLIQTIIDSLRGENRYSNVPLDKIRVALV